jgi:uncharacterized protein YutE (UPF0331/DUF86 family)
LVDREVFDRRLGKLEELLRHLGQAATKDWDAFRSDELLQSSVERWLHLAAECVLDLANHLIADRGWRSPTTYRESFQILEENGVLDSEMTRQMEGWAGLRNVLVHFYMDVNRKRLHEILTHDLEQLRNFAVAISKSAGIQSDG